MNWTMQSYSSCAKQYRKCNVLNVFSIGIKELSTALEGSSWLKANPEESLINSGWMLSLYPALRKKGRCHGVKLKNRKSTKKPGMRGRDAAKELTLKVNISKVIHDRFLRDQGYRESQLQSGWTEQKCIEMDELAKQDHTYRLSSEEEFKRYQEQWYITLSK